MKADVEHILSGRRSAKVKTFCRFSFDNCISFCILVSGNDVLENILSKAKVYQEGSVCQTLNGMAKGEKKMVCCTFCSKVGAGFVRKIYFG